MWLSVLITYPHWTTTKLDVFVIHENIFQNEKTLKYFVLCEVMFWTSDVDFAIQLYISIK